MFWLFDVVNYDLFLVFYVENNNKIIKIWVVLTILIFCPSSKSNPCSIARPTRISVEKDQRADPRIKVLITKIHQSKMFNMVVSRKIVVEGSSSWKALSIVSTINLRTMGEMEEAFMIVASDSSKTISSVNTEAISSITILPLHLTDK